ncbi:hypothetical protein [Psychrobacter sp. CAL346-MNA-CIBAN-0220]|uniref:hypothetical protein n=1 Tax=Psychrobacter sp. CAL346-MNA-CIBAN-0220 TaxID=3140457 RepID=UPI003332F88F
MVQKIFLNHAAIDLGVITIINIHVIFWVALTFFTFLVTVSNIKGYKSIIGGDSTSRALSSDKFDIETSFYRADATLHDIIFFHASASGVAVVLLVLIIKGEVLFPGTVVFFGILSSIAIFAISTVLLLLAFYFYSVSILKLGDTLARIHINGKDIKTMYAILAVFGYFLIFPILALILV